MCKCVCARFFLSFVGFSLHSVHRVDLSLCTLYDILIQGQQIEELFFVKRVLSFFFFILVESPLLIYFGYLHINCGHSFVTQCFLGISQLDAAMVQLKRQHQWHHHLGPMRIKSFIHRSNQFCVFVSWPNEWNEDEYLHHLSLSLSRAAKSSNRIVTHTHTFCWWWMS